jgi:cytochrome P450
VAWLDEARPNSGFWSVHGYADIVAASRDVATFSSARGSPDDDMTARRPAVRPPSSGGRWHPLSEADVANFFSILVVAGNETTRIAIAHGVLAFCQHPEQRERLRVDPGPPSTGISASAAAARTCAWALTWPGWQT